MGVFTINGERIKNPDYNTTIAMFNSIGIIGDSFASGEIYHNGALTDFYNVSWGQIIAKKHNITAINYSKGGLTTKTWLENNQYGLAKLNSESANNLYIIALGINDANQNIPIGSINDIESDSTNSFYSYYGRIIRAIKAHAPNAIIMLSTCARFDTQYVPFSNAIKSIGNYYNIAVFDLSTNIFFKSEFFSNNQISGHPTAINYSAMANEYQYLIEKELFDHPNKYSQYVG